MSFISQQVSRLTRVAVECKVPEDIPTLLRGQVSAGEEHDGLRDDV
jgi:hypothetical protein